MTNREGWSHMDHTIYEHRLAKMKKAMYTANIDYYLVPTADYHQSEYVSDYFKFREYLSGFTGSNGTLLISQDETALWTDGRYFVQAQKELSGTGIVLMKMGEEGVPTIEEYLKSHAGNGQTVGFDGRVVGAYLGKRLEEGLSEKGVSIRYKEDLSLDVWKDRPAFPVSTAKMMPDSLSGETVLRKLGRVREKLKEKHADAVFISKLDDLMWLFNLRGNDVEYNPVLMSYGLIAMDRAVLFLQSGALTTEVLETLDQAGVEIRDYQKALPYLEGYLQNSIAYSQRSIRVMCDTKSTGYMVMRLIKEHGARLVDEPSVIEQMKAVKNPVELAHLREIYLEDSVILTRFIYWIKHRPLDAHLTECDAQEYLDQLRLMHPKCQDLSFPTISAYGSNAAMMHYEATKEHCAILRPQGFLLVDSGGQYDGGTTDVTRTIVMGSLSDEMKKDFTLTLLGMIRLSGARFLHGCTGINLDILARSALWQEGMDYKCGTGHGVGYCLNVHEGPHAIRWKAKPEGDTVLEEGMIVTDEPGVYKAGKYGIRLENVLEVKKAMQTEDGKFMEFHHLTFVPIDREAIDPKLLPEAEKAALNRYHQDVYEKISPYLDEAERQWLGEVTRPI